MERLHKPLLFQLVMCYISSGCLNNKKRYIVILIQYPKDTENTCTSGPFIQIEVIQIKAFGSAGTGVCMRPHFYHQVQKFNIRHELILPEEEYLLFSTAVAVNVLHLIA